MLRRPSKFCSIETFAHVSAGQHWPGRSAHEENAAFISGTRRFLIGGGEEQSSLMFTADERRAGEIRTVYIQHLLHCGVATGYLNRQESLFKTVCTLLNSNTARLHADGGAGQAALYSQGWRDRDGARYIRARRAEARGRVVQEPF